MRRAAVYAGVVLLVSLSACSDKLRTLGPTPSGEGITIYIHADFAGSSQSVNVDVGDLNKVEGPCAQGSSEEPAAPTWSDCISSVRVNAGWSATLYRDREFKGNSVVLTADAPNLRELSGPCKGSFNDCVSSIRVSRQ
jgi:Peptidase inhibitor family I36